MTTILADPFPNLNLGLMRGWFSLDGLIDGTVQKGIEGFSMFKRIGVK